jgi:hypothetical protein
MTCTDMSNRFVLEVFDCTLWCPIAQVRFYPADVGSIRAILELAVEDDPELRCRYCLDDDQIAAVVTTFDAFDPRQIDDYAGLVEIWLSRVDTIEAPYLVHTGWELPLLLEGRKKLAWFSDLYASQSDSHRSPAFDCEDAFDRWVADGVLHKEVIDEPFEKPVGKWAGSRAVYYTPEGEEWRIRAHRLIRDASEKSGGWNEHFERIDGMLLGYEDWQNDCWIKTGLERGAFGGATFCCAVTAAGLAWAESAGLRALPPIEPSLRVIAFRRESSDVDLKELLLNQPDSAVVLRFTVAQLYLLQHIVDSRQGGPWTVPGHQIPELNKHLKGAVVIVARGDPNTRPTRQAE